MTSVPRQSDAEPEVIVFLRERLAKGMGATVVGDAWNNLGGVRPKLLAINPSGERIYSLNARQVEKVVAAWDEVYR